MSQTAAHLVDHVIPHVPVRQWVLSLPIPLRLLLAAQPELVTPVLQVVQRVVTRHLLAAAGLVADEGHGGAVTLIQRFGSAANLDIHLHCLVLDGAYRPGADGVPAFVEADAPADEELQALLLLVAPPGIHLGRSDEKRARESEAQDDGAGLAAFAGRQPPAARAPRRPAPARAARPRTDQRFAGAIVRQRRRAPWVGLQAR